MSGPLIIKLYPKNNIEEFELELSKLENICDHTSIKFSDIRNLISEIKNLREIRDELTVILSHVRQVNEQILEEVQYDNTPVSTKVTTLLSNLIFGEVVASVYKTYQKTHDLFNVAYRQLQTTGSISRDDSVGTAFEKLMPEVSELSVDIDIKDNSGRIIDDETW